MKVTRRMLEARVEFLNLNLNRPTEYAVGFFHLGASNLGGTSRYELLETVNAHGGCHVHFSGNSQNMWAYLRGVDDAIQLQMFPKMR